MYGFARREFQLMLLRRMADFQPELVARACEQLGSTPAQYRKAHNRWQSMLRSGRAPRGLALYRATLGPADVVLEASLVRSSGVPVPSLPPVPELEPWSCVIGDVLACVPGAREIDPDVPTRWLVEVDDAGTTWQLWFVYGLLQAVRADRHPT